VNRAGAPLEQLGTSPTRTGRSLRDVLDFFPVVE
jgi:2-haloacid dehalogenase